MPDNETCEREQKSAAASYRNIPMWMRRIEQKTRRSKNSDTTAKEKQAESTVSPEPVNVG